MDDELREYRVRLPGSGAATTMLLSKRHAKLLGGVPVAQDVPLPPGDGEDMAEAKARQPRNKARKPKESSS